ncbi:TetR/AcrR family transcriptional regulator [Nocardia asteroides]|uniref:TetR/AcrR family transcriptional regulator n=1 Tax=Nocardia asteroides TaxID=1824 RepID=UPI00379BBF4F
MDQGPSSRERMVAGAADMLRRRGLNATSVRELAKHSGTPLGSTYHYFPGGKTQLVTEAVRFADELTARTLTRRLADGPAAGLRGIVDMWRQVVIDSNFQAGCPVLAVAVEEQSESEDDPRRAAADAFTNWSEVLASSLREHGATDEAARQTATLIVASIEGCVAICRAQRSTEALDRVTEALESVIDAVVTSQQ